MVTTKYKSGERPRIRFVGPSGSGIHLRHSVLCEINSRTAYFRDRFVIGQMACDADQVEIIRHADGTPVLEYERWPPLTPYDTGARLEPRVWPLPSRDRPEDADDDRYGRVDFEDDTSTTILNVYVERVDGAFIVHVQPMGDDDITIHLHDA